MKFYGVYNMKKCPKCNSNDIDEGDLRGVDVGSISYYRPRNKKLFKIMPNVTAYVCRNCGYTELYTDTHQLKKAI
jgi:predicted nucleic-acid-binding Zn-ribbon protein